MRAAKSPRLMPFKSRYSASFMEPTFSPAKTLVQVKVLAPLDGQDPPVHRKFSMAKAKGKQMVAAKQPPEERPLSRTFIQKWRKKRGLSQGELAEAIGVSTATISQIENAKSPYSQTQLESIAVALQCDPAELLVRDPADPAPIWGLWDAATPAQRKRILRVISSLLDETEAA